jgi:hypothetical protein
VNFAYQRRVYQCLSVYFGLFRNSSVCFGCFDMDPKHRNEPKQTENQPKQIEFRFVSVRTETLFCLFRGHPNWASPVVRNLRHYPLFVSPHCPFQGNNGFSSHLSGCFCRWSAPPLAMLLASATRRSCSASAEPLASRPKLV